MKVEHKAWVGRYRVQFSLDISTPHEGVRCEWTPHEPSGLTKRERRRYLAARHQFLTDVAKATGLDVMVIDL